MRTGLYLGHAVAGVGIFAVGSALLWPDLINQPTAVRVLPVALGASIGIGVAEWSRRKGALLGRSKPEVRARHDTSGR